MLSGADQPDLPDDAWLHVLSFMNLRDTLSMRLTCRDLCRVVGQLRHISSSWTERRVVQTKLVRVLCTQFQYLRSLDLSSCQKVDDSSVDHICTLKELTRLDLSQTSITNRSLEKLTVLYDSLTSLGLSQTRISDEGVASLAFCEKLEVLEFGRTQITDIGLSAVATLSRLHTLDLYECAYLSFEDISVEMMMRLRNLYLGRSGVRPSCLAVAKQLVELDLSFVRFTVERMEVFQNLRYLEKLRLISTGISSECLRPLLSCTKLKVLDLCYNNLDDAAIFYVGELINLEELLLDECHITTNGLSHLAKLQKLRELDISSTVVDSIAPLSVLQNLQRLHLYGCKVDDDGLSSIRACQHLRYIDLTRNMIKGDGLAYIGECQSLHHVNLFDLYRVNDSHIMHLCNLTKLTCLIVAKTQVSGQGFKDLESALGKKLKRF